VGLGVSLELDVAVACDLGFDLGFGAPPAAARLVGRRLIRLVLRRQAFRETGLARARGGRLDTRALRPDRARSFPLGAEDGDDEEGVSGHGPEERDDRRKKDDRARPLARRPIESRAPRPRERGPEPERRKPGARGDEESPKRAGLGGGGARVPSATIRPARRASEKERDRRGRAADRDRRERGPRSRGHQGEPERERETEARDVARSSTLGAPEA